MRRHHLALLLVLLLTAASVTIALVALDRASGVTRPRGRCCETEFIDTGTLGLLWLLLPVLVVAAAWSWRVALLGIPGAAVPQWLAMDEVVARYAATRWASGLEALGYLVPIGTVLVGAVTVLVGGLVGAALRRRAREAERAVRRDRSAAT